MLILAMMVLIFGVQGISHGQIAPTFSAGDDDTAHRHDGLFLRLSTGIGVTTSTEEVEGREFVFGGVSGNTIIGIGYAIAENLILNLNIFGSTVQDPIVIVDGKEVGEADAEVTISNVGLVRLITLCR